MRREVPIQIPPGVFPDYTDYMAQGRWTDSDRVRFRGDMAETVGGWSKVDNALTVLGKARSALSWRTLGQTDYIAVGTHSHLYIIESGEAHDITPIDTTTTLGTDPFTFTNTSTTVTVSDPGHGRTDGDFVVYSGAAAAHGVTVDGEYEISNTTAIDYTITLASAATSSGTGGGSSVTAKYLVPTGYSSGLSGTGWGTGTYGSSTYGRSAAQGAPVEATIWSLDLWGEDLITTLRNGKTYYWDSSKGVANNRASLMSANAPQTGKLSLVSEDRHVSIYGAYDQTNSVDDPMLVAWSDQEDFDTWTAAATNTAGSQRLTQGTRIVTAVETRAQTLIFTDTSLYGQQFTGPPFTFDFSLLARDVTIAGPRAATEINGLVFWMGLNDFYFYDGSVNVLPCPGRRFVFDNVNRNNLETAFAVVLEQFQEVWFFYPTGSDLDPTRYAAYFYGEPQKNIWHFGTLTRSVMIDAEKFLANPVAIDANGVPYYHETGRTDDGSAMNSYLDSGVFEISTQETGSGGNLMLVDRVIPDIKSAVGNVKFNFYVRKYPQDTETTKGPFSLTTATAKQSFRAKGRQGRIRIYTDEASADFVLGLWRMRVGQEGKR